ncbi:SDR family oxidoreductase [Viridibacterium curvum]|uniref:SDR family oxidoreductase n=1 Tax=Viridibacterium curvum TaxID=1101404 RepID=A0ABP9QNM4_9RHOO
MTTYLITGASGKLGQAVLHHLLDTLRIAPGQIIATSRKPESLRAVAERGVTVRTADFDDAASLPAAFAGAQRVLLISTDSLERPGRRQEQHERAIAAAEKAGVQHLIYTSAPKPGDNSPLLIAADHAGTEQAIARSSIPGWTILRNHWYFENFLFTLPGVFAQGGKWFSAAGDGKLANISRDDLAYAAAVALVSTESGRNTYTLSGSEAHTTAEQAAILSAALDKPIAVIPVPVEGIVQGMVGAGFPEPLARALASFDTNTAAGRVAEVTGDYQRLTGKAPQRFADWVQANKALLSGN